MVTVYSKLFDQEPVTKVLFASSKPYMTDDGDQLYIRKTLDGDTLAFTVLVNRYKDMVFNLALRMLKNREESEEVAQDAFVMAYNSLEGFKGDAKFSTWVYRITYNACLDRLRAFGREKPKVILDDGTAYQYKIQETSLDLLEAAERKQTVHDCLQELVAEDSALMTLYYLEEMTLKEISKIVGLPKGTIKVRLFRARKKLATLLALRLEPDVIKCYGDGKR